MKTDRCDLGNISLMNRSGHGPTGENKECPERLPLPRSPLHTLQGQM